MLCNVPVCAYKAHYTLVYETLLVYDASARGTDKIVSVYKLIVGSIKLYFSVNVTRRDDRGYCNGYNVIARGIYIVPRNR